MGTPQNWKKIIKVVRHRLDGIAIPTPRLPHARKLMPLSVLVSFFVASTDSLYAPTFSYLSLFHNTNIQQVTRYRLLIVPTSRCRRGQTLSE